MSAIDEGRRRLDGLVEEGKTLAITLYACADASMADCERLQQILSEMRNNADALLDIAEAAKAFHTAFWRPVPDIAEEVELRARLFKALARLDGGGDA
jgi:hypothetical protein